MRPVQVSLPEGQVSIPLAERFRERLLGVLRSGTTTGLVLPGCSVHGLGLSRPWWAVGVGAGGTVLGVRRLRPWRVVWVPGARWVLELPISCTPPAVGARVW